MNQVRFKVGVPRAGSAAREAENSAGEPLGSIRPRAGSAARDAEERKRAEGSAVLRSAAVGMRVQGGRVVTPEEMQAASARPSAVPQVVASGVQTGSVRVVRPATVAASRASLLGVADLPPADAPEQVVEESASSRPLQAAAVRLKSLVQSLFSPGVSSGKP